MLKSRASFRHAIGGLRIPLIPPHPPRFSSAAPPPPPVEDHTDTNTSSTGGSAWIRPSGGHNTGITIYNCVARQKVPLILRHPAFATWYSCGPTVYDATHIGHASCYVKQDIVQRTLRDHFHIRLVTAMNVTDVDDKIIERSAANGEPWHELAQRYETDFWTDLSRLGCAVPNVKMRVSEHMSQIVAFVQRLLDDQHAYRTDDGSVYFEVERHHGYGKLQRLYVDGSSKAAGGKRIAADFALWKGRAQPAKHEPVWSVPWSPHCGRPGWHIECSAMASHLFGGQIDFHAGGLDLRFPHHENEEAQSCAHHKCDQWVNYWMHTGQLHVLGDEAKMSKSLRNTVSVGEMLRTATAVEFRMLCLLSNYQNQIEYGGETMDVARSIVQKMNTFAADCEAFVQGQRPVAAFDAAELRSKMSDTCGRIDAALRDNFNTSKCVEHLLELVTHCNRLFKVKPRSQQMVSSGEAPLTAATPDLSTVVAVGLLLDRYRSMWGVGRAQPTVAVQEDEEQDQSARHLQRVMDSVLRARSNIRAKAMESRKKELFLACDEIRDSLRTAGVQVKDSNGGATTWHLDETALLVQKK